jgi:hypothetical protein
MRFRGREAAALESHYAELERVNGGSGIANATIRVAMTNGRICGRNCCSYRRDDVQGPRGQITK